MKPPNDHDGASTALHGSAMAAPAQRTRIVGASSARAVPKAAVSVLAALRPASPTAPLITVALIENNRMVRDGMTALLGKSADFSVVAGEAAGSRAMLAKAQPQVILLDVGLWADQGLKIADLVMREHPAARVIITDLPPMHEDLIEFVNAGVCGFILKDATVEDLVATIRTVAEGDQVLPPEMTSTLFSQIAKEALVRGRAVAGSTVRMTAREREVIALIGEGLSNKEIAARLTIATHTVKSHVRNVMEKLALHTRLQIAAFAHRRGPE